MSAKTSAMDRKIHRTLVLIGVMVLIPVLLAIRSYISSTGESRILASPVPTDERLIIIDGRQMLFNPSELGRVMTGWVESPKEKTLSVELSDLSFVPASPATSKLGDERVQQVAGVTKADPHVVVHVLVPTNVSAANRQLDEQRAARLHDALLSYGLSQSKVAVGAETSDLPTADSAQITFLLSK